MTNPRSVPLPLQGAPVRKLEFGKLELVGKDDGK